MPLQLEDEARLELTLAIAGRSVTYELSQDPVTFRTKGAMVEARRVCRECPLCGMHWALQGGLDAGDRIQAEGRGGAQPPHPEGPQSCKTGTHTGPTVPASVSQRGAQRTRVLRGGTGGSPVCVSPICHRRDSGNRGPCGFQQGEVTGPPAQGMYFLGTGSSGTNRTTWESVTKVWS